MNGGRRQPFSITLTSKGWLAAGPDVTYLRAPCSGCQEMVTVKRSGLYGRFGRRHRCPQPAPTAVLRRVA